MLTTRYKLPYVSATNTCTIVWKQYWVWWMGESYITHQATVCRNVFIQSFVVGVQVDGVHNCLPHLHSREGLIVTSLHWNTHTIHTVLLMVRRTSMYHIHTSSNKIETYWYSKWNSNFTRKTLVPQNKYPRLQTFADETFANHYTFLPGKVSAIYGVSYCSHLNRVVLPHFPHKSSFSHRVRNGFTCHVWSARISVLDVDSLVPPVGGVPGREYPQVVLCS